MENWGKGMKLKLVDNFTDFGKGFLAGFLIAAVFFGLALGLIIQRIKAKEIIKYVETQQVIEALREEYGNRDPIEFIDTIPDVRRAADRAAGEFERKRDEAVERFRGGFTGRGNFGSGTGSD
jgi:hypothetical protein